MQINANSVKSIPRNNKFEKQNKFLNWQFQQMILCRAIKSLLGDPNIINLCSLTLPRVEYGFKLQFFVNTAKPDISYLLNNFSI